MAKIKLKSVRLSFPSVFKKASFNGEEGKYEATFLIPKSDKATYDAIMAEVEAKKKEHKVKIPADKICIKDGDDIDYDGYANCQAIKASNSKRPTVVNRDRSPIVEDDDIIYAGCYVNAVLDLWVQNNSFGRRINANLLGIQFVKDGEPFGDGAKVASEDDFDDIDDEDDVF